MPTITAQQIADKAWTIVNEGTGTDAVRWPVAETLGWINDAQRACVTQSPKSNPVRAVVAAVAGTRQTLAALGLATGIQLLDVIRNFASNGTTPGRAMTKRARAWFDDQMPDWHSDTGPRAIHWTFDPMDPKTFYIWPAITGGGKLEVLYSAAPADLDAMSDLISLDDSFANAIQYYVLFCFYRKDTNYTLSQQKAATYYQLFQGELGIQAQNIVTADQGGTAKAAG